MGAIAFTGVLTAFCRSNLYLFICGTQNTRRVFEHCTKRSHRKSDIGFKHLNICLFFRPRPTVAAGLVQSPPVCLQRLKPSWFTGEGALKIPGSNQVELVCWEGEAKKLSWVSPLVFLTWLVCISLLPAETNFMFNISFRFSVRGIVDL